MNTLPLLYVCPPLDAMLTRSECAAWLRMSERDLQAKSSGRDPVIPVFRTGHKNLLYHPRTVIAKLARDAGVSRDTINASLAQPEGVKPS